VEEEVYWYSQREVRLSLTLGSVLQADAVVVGGGIAGLSTAQWLREEAGIDVVVLEARFCGAGASGKSSGFITPDSELELHQLARRFGDDDARRLWRASTDGCEQIRRNVERFQIDCDFVEADSLYVANSEGEFSTIRQEHEAHRRLGFPSQLYTRDELSDVLGGDGYRGGVRYGGTFGINAFAYAQGLKDALIAQGVRVFENSPAVEVMQSGVRTPQGVVRAKLVFVCLDRYAPDLDISVRDNYHAQTFITLSEPLGEEVLRQLFPEKAMLVWDTDLIYQYFRPTGDGRLLVGGGSLRETFRREESHGNRAVERLIAYIRGKFPALGGARFTHYWPGLIGITKDLLPLAGRSPHEANRYYAMCAAGLPWSTLAGRVAARCAIEGATQFDRFFSPARAFITVDPLQPLLSKPLTFALSNYYAKNFQRGHAPDVARRQDWVLAGLCLLAVTAGFGVGRTIVSEKRERSR
jgi:gamma-glutamylputrescine oxidase